jgi:flagellar basal body rod protein FlgB
MIDNSSKEMLVVMLDAVMHQQKLLAENIVSIHNKAETASYISFDKIMDELSTSSGASTELKNISDRINNHDFDTTVNNSVAGNLDKEIAMMSSNVVRYKALLSAMNKHGSIMRTVIDAQR